MTLIIISTKKQTVIAISMYLNTSIFFLAGSSVGDSNAKLTVEIRIKIRIILTHRSRLGFLSDTNAPTEYKRSG